MVLDDAVAASLITEITAAVPKLAGAACRTRRARAVFDRATVQGPGMRIARRKAVGICLHCPALDACRQWAHSMPEAQRPYGILAGELVKSRSDPVLAGRRRRRVAS